MTGWFEVTNRLDRRGPADPDPHEVTVVGARRAPPQHDPLQQRRGDDGELVHQRLAQHDAPEAAAGEADAPGAPRLKASTSVRSAGLHATTFSRSASSMALLLRTSSLRRGNDGGAAPSPSPPPGGGRRPWPGTARRRRGGAPGRRSTGGGRRGARGGPTRGCCAG